MTVSSNELPNLINNLYHSLLLNETRPCSKDISTVWAGDIKSHVNIVLATSEGTSVWMELKTTTQHGIIHAAIHKLHVALPTILSEEHASCMVRRGLDLTTPISDHVKPSKDWTEVTQSELSVLYWSRHRASNSGADSSVRPNRTMSRLTHSCHIYCTTNTSGLKRLFRQNMTKHKLSSTFTTQPHQTDRQL